MCIVEEEWSSTSRVVLAGRFFYCSREAAYDSWYDFLHSQKFSELFRTTQNNHSVSDACAIVRGISPLSCLTEEFEEILHILRCPKNSKEFLDKILKNRKDSKRFETF